MPILHIKGKVFPRALELTINNLPPVDWDEPGIGQKVKITTRIENSAVDLQFDLNRYEKPMISISSSPRRGIWPAWR